MKETELDFQALRTGFTAHYVGLMSATTTLKVGFF